MYGLILDMYWDADGDPVTVTATGTLEELRALLSVNPDAVADTWPRNQVKRIEPKQVNNSKGDPSPLNGWICERVGP